MDGRFNERGKHHTCFLVRMSPVRCSVSDLLYHTTASLNSPLRSYALPIRPITLAIWIWSDGGTFNVNKSTARGRLPHFPSTIEYICSAVVLIFTLMPYHGVVLEGHGESPTTESYILYLFEVGACLTANLDGFLADFNACIVVLLLQKD